MTSALTDDNPFEDLSYAEAMAEINKHSGLVASPSNYGLVREFHEKKGMTLDKWPPILEEVTLREKLISEEFCEFGDEFFSEKYDFDFNANPDKRKVAKELADLLYVAYGTAASFGIPIDRVFKEVHLSNMSKLVDGKPLLRTDGKVLKGPQYKPPDLSWLE